MSSIEEPDFEKLESALGFTTLDADATHMHELFTSLMKAGFTESQALRLVSLLVDVVDDDTTFFLIDGDEE